jgi:hypothetical protein
VTFHNVPFSECVPMTGSKCEKLAARICFPDRPQLRTPPAAPGASGIKRPHVLGVEGVYERAAIKPTLPGKTPWPTASAAVTMDQPKLAVTNSRHCCTIEQPVPHDLGPTIAAEIDPHP